MEDFLEQITRERDRIEAESLDPNYAFHSRGAIRRSTSSPSPNDFRSPFAHDTDRIIHSHAYARYMDKTQVFFQIKNDHITRRSLHVQMVSRIARTIGRCLRLNEDLIEAIAVGHDIGHTPFGHAGEHILGKLLQECHAGTFVHNAQSVRVLQYLEHDGQGCDLTLPVLDGILGHNGEQEQACYTYNPAHLTWETLEANLKRCFQEPGADKTVFPSTLEGCVVRVADMIAYLGKDFEDAVTLQIIAASDLPINIRRVLGDTNRDMVNTLCSDVIQQSYGRGMIAFSDHVFSAFRSMKAFNYERIYHCSFILAQRKKFDAMVRQLFAAYLDDLETGRDSSPVFDDFVARLPESYIKTTSNERIVADFIAGMTDQYFLKQYTQRFIPLSVDYDQTPGLCRLPHA